MLNIRETELKLWVADTINDHPRNIYDLCRMISLFIPKDHVLETCMKSCFNSMLYAAPESHDRYLTSFGHSLAVEFPPETFLEEAPWWAKVISILITGGQGPMEELYDSLENKFSLKDK